jgi:RNA ligase (TIGR02306 family)
MSEFNVRVVKIGPVEKHPNADTLSITYIDGDKELGYPVIFRTGDFEEGQLATYVPVDSIVPDSPEWAFLSGHRRIKARKLRGVFSMGLFTKALPEWIEGQNVQKVLGIEKWEPELDRAEYMNTENESDPGFLPVYTDIEGLRKHKGVFVTGEEVVLTEKVHGSNSRFLFKNNRLWVGSHKNVKKFDERNLWWKLASDYFLQEKLATIPDIAVYGEAYGQVQDLRYGITSGVKLICFDAMYVNTRRYLDYDDFRALISKLDLNTAPELYRGPWTQNLLSLAEGKTTLPNADHVREGFVARPIKERWDHKCGRVILKMIGEGYLLRKSA